MTDQTTNATLVNVEELKNASEPIRKTLEELDKLLLGRTELHKLVMAAILSRGHILFEGLPGVGKTALVRALASLMGLDFKRVQFTPDLMPGDILGTHLLQETDKGHREMTFVPGPVFTNLMLADEINRASPKTQSALLEAMEEKQVTLMGKTSALPSPFFVLASQNPIELEGTYPLPEAQLDRFIFKLHVNSADVACLEEIISNRRRGSLPQSTWQISDQQLGSVFEVMDKIFLPKPVAKYISRLVAATHADSPEATDKVKNYVTYGGSPRAAIALAEASRGIALIEGRPSVGFEDVKTIATAVLNHRIILNYQARFDNISTLDVVKELLEKLDETGMNLPVELDA